MAGLSPSPSPSERRRGGGGGGGGGRAATKAEMLSVPQLKVKPPNKKKFEHDGRGLLNEIKEKEAQLKSLAKVFTSDTSAEAAAMSAQLGEVEGRRAENAAKLRRVEGEIKQKGIDVTQKRDAANKLIAGVRFKSEEKIDETVGKLEQQLLTRQFSGSEERKLQHEIDSLQLSKESLRAYLAMKEEIDGLRNQQDALRKERDELYRSNRDLLQEELSVKDRQKELKKEVEERGRQRRQAGQTKKQLTQEITVLYARRRQLYDDFKEQQAAWMDATRKDREAEEELLRQRDKDRRAVREASRRRRQVMAVETQKELQYEDEKTICRALLSHMQRMSLSLSGEGSPLLPARSAMMGPLHQTSTSPSLTSRQPSSSTEEEPPPGQFLPLRRRDDEEEVLVRSTSRRRSRKDRKRTSPANKVQKRLNHNATIFSQFSMLNLTAPATAAEIPTTLSQLQEKLAFYESLKRADSDVRADSEAGDSGVGSTGYIDVLGSMDDINLNSDTFPGTAGVSPKRSLTDDSALNSKAPSLQSSVDESTLSELTHPSPTAGRPVAITITPSPPNSTTTECPPTTVA